MRSRILLAAAVALLVALLTGVFVARALTVRLLRLERIAQRVAIGDFEAHFSDSSRDELGRLAQALAHMQRQLEGLEDARRRFIATASHELRTPIFSLGGFLELIQDEDLDDETRRQFVGQVREQVDRLGKLATQLLDLSRLESGSVQLSPTTTDIGVLARGVSSEFVPALAAARLVARPAHAARAGARDLRRRARRPAAADPDRQRDHAHAAGHRGARHGRRRRRRRGDARGQRRGARESRPRRSSACSSRSTAPTGRAAPASVSRSRTSSHCRWRARLEVSSAPGDTTFTLILAAPG